MQHSAFKLVERFNKEILGITRQEIKALHPDEMNWLLDRFDEEKEELKEAIARGDIIGQVDAMLDLIYFAMGGLTRLGLTGTQQDMCFGLVHAANMSKAKGKKNRKVSHELDAVKPIGWNPPEEAMKLILFGDPK